MVAVWIRYRLKESPLKEVFTHSRPNLLVGIGLRMAENGNSYIFQALAVSFVAGMGVSKTVVVIAVGIGFGVNGMLGSQCALLPELFGNRHRYIGVAISREFSAVIAGGLAPVLGAWLLSISGNAWWPIAIYVLVLGAITLTTTFITPETVGRDLTLTTDATRADSVKPLERIAA